MTDPFTLSRFVKAQATHYEAALAELAAGRKESHWMWFIFPQLFGLGRSAMADTYGISGLPEAQAYLAHPILGPRLATCTRTVLDSEAASLTDLFGTPDDMKFRSCMTLFALADGSADNLYQTALSRWCDGHPDRNTLILLKRQG
ncbi:DUF1810 domain-containing protein [Niveispirillum irakense]|uniref:DUF1810 domain-containing protein n=1 Tax=Niveispirillum irakense TaxID=34011 RepID=UPI000413D65D|nr:DUF1810 domain-containing protein [Niveispirillum irakense]